MSKGDLVTYKVQQMTVQAIVRTVHRDGTATVEARFELRNGKPFGGFLGYRYRMKQSDLRAKG